METTKFNIVPVIFNPSPSILCAVNLDGKIPQRTNIQQRLLNRNQDVNCLLGNLRKLSFARNFLEVVYFQFSGNSLSEFSGNLYSDFFENYCPPPSPSTTRLRRWLFIQCTVLLCRLQYACILYNLLQLPKIGTVLQMNLDFSVINFK